MPARQPKKGRLWLNDGSCVRLRPESSNHVWSHDFVHCRRDDGKVLRTLNILDEFSRECLAIRVKRKRKTPYTRIACKGNDTSPQRLRQAETLTPRSQPHNGIFAPPRGRILRRR